MAIGDLSGCESQQTKLLILPRQSTPLFYTGEIQSPSWINYDENLLTVDGELSGKNANTYTCTFTPVQRYWTDINNNSTRTTAWSISRQVLSIPYINHNLTYSGELQSPNSIIEELNEFVTLTSTSARSAGTYTYTVSINDTNNYQWADGTTSNKTLTYIIDKYKLDFPEVANTELEYIGSEQGPLISHADLSKLTVSNRMNTNAGTYTCTVSINDTNNYEWINGETNTCNYVYTINKASPWFTINETNINMEYEYEIPITYIGDGEINIDVEDDTILSCIYENNILLISSLKPGSTNINISFTAGTNYLASNIVTLTVTANRLDEYTVSLLQFNENIDDKVTTSTWSNVNTVVNDTNARFGDNALQVENGTYIANMSGITLGGQDFTIDLWAYMSTSNANSARIFDIVDNPNKTNSSNNRITLLVRGCLCVGATSIESDTALSGSLMHLAVVYTHANATSKLYKNGALVATLTSCSLSRGTFYPLIGYNTYDGSATDIGTIDEFRISDGIARWTDTFTPPIHPYFEVKQENDIITTTLNSYVSVERTCTTVNVSGAFTISWEYFATSNSLNAFVLLATQAYTGTGTVPSWGSTWVCGQGVWTSNNDTNWPYNTSVGSSGNWAASTMLNEWHSAKMVYNGTNSTTYYRDDTVIGTCSGAISGTKYLCTFFGIGQKIRNLKYY